MSGVKVAPTPPDGKSVQSFLSSANPMCKHVMSMCSHTKIFERNCVVKWTNPSARKDEIKSFSGVQFLRS